ncbi:MAG: type 4a pilus biogenesis protein PilO [Magnetococcales bacterium]|nr:type 4a pilus biogenesis protein PilO [Magnetococcales bacterium]
MELGFDPLVILRLKPLYRIGISAGLIFILVVGYGWFVWRDRHAQMEQLRADIQQQTEQLASKRRLLAQLPKKREELAVLKAEEERLAQKLPSEKEIPNLLTDISNAGHEQGLEFVSFAPGAEISRELYAEVPVGIEVRGSFHATALFIHQVAQMPRIVTFADLIVETNKEKGNILQTKARAATYRFLNQQALAQKGQEAKGAGKK